MKKVIVFLCILSILTGMAFAGGKSDSGQAGGPVTIRFTTWDTANQLAVYQFAIDKFMKDNPDIKVLCESVPDSYDQKLFTAAAAKNAPDAFLWWNFPLLIEKKIVVNLDKYIGTLINKSDFYPTIWNTCTVNGVLYGVPNIPTTRAFYYNKNMFKAAGVPFPTDDWTWDDFVDKAKKLTQGDNYGFVTEPKNTYTLQQFVWMNGGDFISPDGKKVDGIMNSAKTAEALQWYADLVIKHKVSPAPSSSTTMGGPHEMFKTGKVAMIESGLWPLNDFKKGQFEVGTVMVPKKDGKRIGVLHSSGVCVSVDSKYQEAAVKFATTFGGKDTQTELVKLQYGIPSMPSVAEASKIAEDPLRKPFLDMIPYCTVTPAFYSTPQWSMFDEQLGNAMEEAQYGKATAQAALNNAVKEIIASQGVGN